MAEKKYIIDNEKLMSEWDWDKNNKLGLNPKTLSTNSNKKANWICSKGHKWFSVISHRSKNTGCPYCTNQKILSGYNDLATTHPNIAKEWHPSKNGNIKPNMIFGGSGKKYWWKCKNGHEWLTSPNKRTSDGTGCPFCSNKKVLSGYNDLESQYPTIAKQWNYEKNNGLLPSQITPSSSKRVWWICEKGHEWQTAPYNRIKHKNCPICAKQHSTSMPEQTVYYYVKKAFDDAINSYNDIGMELDIFIPSIRTAIEYDGVYYHGTDASLKREKKKNEICKLHNIRLIRIREEGLYDIDNCETIIRTNLSTFSSLNDVIMNLLNALGIGKFDIDVERDFNSILNLFIENEIEGSISKIYPNLAKYWHPTKNGKLMPNMISANSGKKVWWVCEKGHEWEASPHNRAKGKGCPYCRGRYALSGKTDFSQKYPLLLEEWDYERNTNINPYNYSSGSEKIVWWKCNKGHIWQAKISARCKGNKCPYCSNKKVLKGYNDFATTHPNLAKEWNTKKNGSLRPDELVAGSGKKVWWICSKCGFEWNTSIEVRSRGNNCPNCAGNARKKVLNIDTGEIFDTLSVASKHYNISITPISNCCKGKQKTASGYHWKFID